MNQTLLLMSELHSDDMQERHWQDLSNYTSSIINQDDANFCFRDLYKLDLHLYTEQVNDIVEVAKNQTKIKKNLDKIKKFWDDKKFVWKEFPEKETYLLEKTEDIIESVDVDLGNLQTMMAQKRYIA